MKEINSKLTRYQKRNGKNTMENFGMSKVAKVKKEQKRRGEAKGQTTTNIITIEELNEVHKHAKNRKSCGLDNLSMELWKFGGNELRIQLLELLNKIVDKNQMPQECETGRVINIHKKGTKSKCENYRGITLLPTAYKLFTNIIKKTD